MGASWVQHGCNSGKKTGKNFSSESEGLNSKSQVWAMRPYSPWSHSSTARPSKAAICQLGPSPWSLRKISSSVLRNGHFVPLALCLGAFTYPQLEFQNNARKAGRMLKRKTAKTQYRLGIGQYQLRNVAPRRTHQRYWPVLSVIKVEKGWNKSHLWLDIAWQKVGKHSQPVYQFSEVSKRQHQDFCKMCSICCSWSVWFQLFPEPVQV